MEKEIPETKGATLREVLCTRCGVSTQSFLDERWLCDCIVTRVESIFNSSKQIRNWTDVMTKLTRLYCLNEAERQSGFEASDVIVEEGDGYTLVMDKRGWLLIVVHDQMNTQNLLKKMQQTPQRRMTVDVTIVNF